MLGQVGLLSRARLVFISTTTNCHCHLAVNLQQTSSRKVHLFALGIENSAVSWCEPFIKPSYPPPSPLPGRYLVASPDRLKRDRLRRPHPHFSKLPAEHRSQPILFPFFNLLLCLMRAQ